jgi:hypothetical protein
LEFGIQYTKSHQLPDFVGVASGSAIHLLCGVNEALAVRISCDVLNTVVRNNKPRLWVPNDSWDLWLNCGCGPQTADWGVTFASCRVCDAGH